MIDGEHVRVVLEHTSPGASEQQLAFTFEFQGAPVLDDAVMDDIETWAGTSWGLTWRDLASVDTTLQRVSAQVIDLEGKPVRDLGTRGISLSGTQSQGILPAAASGYLQANVSEPKRKGSKYVPGLTEAQLDAGLFNGQTLQILGELVIEYLSPLIIATLSELVPGILSIGLQKFIPFNGSGYTTDVPAYQRRRKPGVGI